MAGRIAWNGATLRWGFVAVAVCLLSLVWASRTLAQVDEVDAILDAEAAEAQAMAVVEVAIEEEATAAMAIPQFEAFTAEADETLSESSEIIGPIANLTADPVLGDGEFVLRKTHLHVPGYGVPFEVGLTYRSRTNFQSSVGFGWSHNYARHVEDVLPSGGHDCEGDVVYVDEAMERITFRPVFTSYRTGVTSYRATTADVPIRLEKQTKGPSLYVVTDGSGLSYGFNKVGGQFASLTRVSDAAGNSLTIAWNNSITNDDGGIVTRVIDTSGRNFFYNYVTRQRQRDPALCAALSGLLGSWFEDVCPTITMAQLACVSQKQNDCSAALVSFKQTFPDDDGEFDLTSVLDADGHGPTFTYSSGFPKVSYVADDQLTPACHLLCDKQSDAPTTWSCHNQDLCTHAIDNSIDTLCEGINHPIGAPANGYSCDTYCGQACQDSSGQPCFADGFDHKVDLNFVSCGEEDDFDPGANKDFWHALCECDTAADLGFCNSPDPSVQAAIAANQQPAPYAEGDKDQCNDVESHASASVAHADVCPSFSATCYSRIGNEINTTNANCSTKCFQDCHETDGAKDATGERRYAFGRPQDLNHNLVEVHDGDGRLVVHNDYGQDPFENDFDRVVKNRAGDATDSTITYAYHDLDAEQAVNGGDFLAFFEGLGLSPLEIWEEALSLDSGTPPYSVHPDPENVVPLSQFDSVDVCGDSCANPVVPPFTEVASAGMLQWSAIDAKKSGAVWVGDPVVLSPGGHGTYSVVSGPPRQVGAGQVLWASVSAAGGVRLRATASPDTFSIEGNAAAVAAAFGPDSKLELRQGQGLSYSANAPLKPASTTLAVAGKAKPFVPAVKKATGREPFDLKIPRKGPAPASLFSTAMARAGISIGSAPLVLERKGNVATLVLPAAGMELARASSANGQIGIKATGAPRTLALTGSVAAAADDHGRIAIVSLPDGSLAVVPVSAVLGGQRVNIGLGQAIADGVLTDGMACRGWKLEPAGTATTVTDVQRPQHAVVVNDLHGVIRTEYYDTDWRLLRNVNRTTSESIDYNYRNGTLHGVRDAAGTRTCIAADYYGKPLNVTKLPAPGDTQSQVSQYSYTPHGALVDFVKDPGLPTQASVHRERDAWDRMLWIDTQIGGAASERTTYSYGSSPQFDAHAIFPTGVVTPDGATTTLAYDPSGAGPIQITTEVPGSSPLRLFMQYDSLGRLLEQGRSAHWGSNSAKYYDAAGLVTWEAKADALNAGQWIATTINYDGSRQRFHEAGPRLDRWLTFDALDHPRTLVETAKDSTPQKSHCERHSSDGRLDYAIDPEGIVTHDFYDGNNRLVRVDRGHPPNLSAWTNACLAGAPAPLAFRPFPLPSPIITGLQAQTAPGGTPQVTNGQIMLKLPPATFKIVAQPIAGGVFGRPRPMRPPQPQWPTTIPQNDPGMQTIAVRKYVPGGALISEVDGSGVGKFYVRDGFGRVIDEMNADPATADAATIVHRWRGYDTQNRVIWEALLSGPNLPAYAKPAGLFSGLQSMVERQYDSAGRVIGQDDWRFANGAQLGPALAVHTSYAYDDAHRTLTTTIGSHPPRVTTFDTLGRPLSDQLPNGAVRTAVWREVVDGDEQDVTSPAPDGTSLTLTEHFDDRGLGTGTRQGADQLEQKVYDSYGQMVSTVTGQLITTNYSYDDYGRRTGYTIAGAPGPSRSVHFAYDGDDRRSAITTTNALGDHTTSFVFDGLSRIMETDAPLARVTTRSYVAGSSRMSSAIDPAGTTTSLVYDAAGRKVSEIVKPGSAPGLAGSITTRSFTYSPFGMKTATVTTVPADAASGSTVTMTYDSSGHQIAESSGALVPLAIGRVFDDMGSVTSTTLSPATGTPLILSAARDQLGRLTDAGVGGRPLSHLTYAGLGDPSAIDFGGRASSPGQGAGVTAHISYDARGRRSGIDVSYGTSGADAAVAKWHDFVGLEGIPRARVRQLASNPPRTDLYEIDAGGPLIAEGDSASLTAPLPNRELVNADVQAALAAAPQRESFTLDGEANRLSVTTQSQTSTNQIDATDAYTSVGGVPLATNAVGETVSTGPSNLVFDGLGQLVSATAGSTSISYSYDALGRRIEETLNTTGQPSASTFFMWDGSVLRATTNSATDASQARVYVSGNGPQDLLAVVDGFGAGATHYVHQGGDRSVFALSGDGGLVEGYLYDAFGGTSVFDASGQPRGASALGMRALYQGQLYDPNLAMYAMGAREYSPALGRFVSLDPAGFEGGDNLYAFAAGMPLTRIDPTGLASQGAIDDSITRMIAEDELNMGALTIDEEVDASEVTAKFTLEDIPDLTSELDEFDVAEGEVTTGTMPTALTPVAEAEDTTPFELNLPVSDPLDDTLDEEVTLGANSQTTTEPVEPTDQSYGTQPIAYNTLSGHGFWDEAAANEEPQIMPEDKRLLGWGTPGMIMTDPLGNAVESGDIPLEPTWSVEPGEMIPPQLKLEPPANPPPQPPLNIGSSPISNVITVQSTQSAGDLIVNGPPGDYYWCACMIRVDLTGAIIPEFAEVDVGGIR
jgi:RHS repeat-associated protein